MGLSADCQLRCHGSVLTSLLDRSVSQYWVPSTSNIAALRAMSYVSLLWCSMQDQSHKCICGRSSCEVARPAAHVCHGLQSGCGLCGIPHTGSGSATLQGTGWLLPHGTSQSSRPEVHMTANVPYHLLIVGYCSVQGSASEELWSTVASAWQHSSQAPSQTLSNCT